MENKQFQKECYSVTNLLSGYVEVKAEPESRPSLTISPRMLQQFSGQDPYQDKKRGISHTKRVYHSFKEAREVLDYNRGIFDRVMQRLNELEEKKYRQIHSLTSRHLASLRLIKLKQNFPCCSTHLRNHSVGRKKEVMQSISLPSISGLGTKRNSATNSGTHSAVTKILQRRFVTNLPYRWIRCFLKGWHAETREGGTFITLTIDLKQNIKEQRAYLFGGLGRELYSNLVYLKLTSEKTGYEWVYEKIGEPQLKRYAHAACAWENKLLIVSGSKLYSKEIRRRDCLDDAYLFDPVSREWTQLKWSGSIYPRRYHVCCAVGKHVLIHGGIDSLDKYVSETVVLNLGRRSECGFYHLSLLHSKGENPFPLISHSCNLITASCPSKYKGLYTNKYNVSEQEENIFIEGIYIFGGKNESGPNNTLNVLKIGRKPCEWIQPETRGMPPPPRFGHSSVYYPDKKILVIFGGRNDANYALSIPAFLNDIWILNVKQLEWSQWDYRHYTGYLPEGRYSHCATLLDQEMIVFGGLGEGNYCRSEVITFQMDIKSSQLRDKERAEPESIPTEEADCLPLLTQNHF